MINISFFYIYIFNRIAGVMVGMLSSSARDRAIVVSNQRQYHLYLLLLP